MLQNWPPQSPDFNIIEQFVAILKWKLSKFNFTNVNELFEIANNLWNEIPIEDLLCMNHCPEEVELLKQTKVAILGTN